MSLRWLAAIGLILVGSLLSVRAADDKDISLKESGQYLGGIDRYWQLSITGPKEKKWEYTFTHGPAGAVEQGDIKTGGVYEFSGDLVVFSGKRHGKDQRFGLNYGFPDGKVQFNGFFPTADDTLRYHRQWFELCNGRWEVVEEITLTMPRRAPEGNRWQIPVTGEHLRRDAAGKQQRTKIDEKLDYDRLVETPQFRLHRPRGRIPFTLIPQVKEGNLTAALTTAEGHSPFGFVRGFHPALADLMK